MPYKDLAKRRENERRRRGKEYWKKYHAEHKEARLAQQRAYYEKHRKEIIARGVKWVKEHPERRKQIRRNYAQKLKREVLTVYSNGNAPKCNYCGITDIDILCIDHINNGGREHRKVMKADGRNFYQWLKNNNYPLGFQALCFNCNAKRQIGK